MMAALVWVAGVIAEIMFHDIFAVSVLGVVLQTVLAAAIIACTYFVLDGVVSGIRAVLKNGKTGSGNMMRKFFGCWRRSCRNRTVLQKRRMLWSGSWRKRPGIQVQVARMRLFPCCTNYETVWKKKYRLYLWKRFCQSIRKRHWSCFRPERRKKE